MRVCLLFGCIPHPTLGATDGRVPISSTHGRVGIRKLRRKVQWYIRNVNLVSRELTSGDVVLGLLCISTQQSEAWTRYLHSAYREADMLQVPSVSSKRPMVLSEVAQVLL